MSVFNPCNDVSTATKLGYCVTPLHYINKDHVTHQRAMRLDERMAFRPVVKPKDAEFHNIIPATKVLVFLKSVLLKQLGGMR